MFFTLIIRATTTLICCNRIKIFYSPSKPTSYVLGIKGSVVVISSPFKPLHVITPMKHVGETACTLIRTPRGHVHNLIY